MLLEPYFKKAIVGQFVRISIGELDGIAVYRMAEVCVCVCVREGMVVTGN